MKHLALIFLVLVSMISICLAQDEYDEDFLLAREMLAKKLYGPAAEIAARIADDKEIPVPVRYEAANLHLEIVYLWGKNLGKECPTTVAKLKEKYKDLLTSPPPELRPEFWLKKAVETVDEWRNSRNKEKKKEAAKIFEESEPGIRKAIENRRLEVAKYPPQHEWSEWAKKASTQEQAKLMDALMRRDSLELRYAESLLYKPYVVPEEDRKKVVQAALKKFERFMEGAPEYEGDFDPPPKGGDKPVEPEPRTSFPMLFYKAELGIGKCHLKLGNYKKAVEHFDYMTAAELPPGEGNDKNAIKEIVEIRLEAHYLKGCALNLDGKHEKAEKVFREVCALANKQIQPDRAEIAGYWKNLGKPEIALMPDVTKTEWKAPVFLELGKSMIALGKVEDGLDCLIGAFEKALESKAVRKIFFFRTAAEFKVEAVKYLTSLPAPEKRTKEQREHAQRVAILLGKARFETGEYREAAGLFDMLRRTAECPKCGYEKILELGEFDKPLPHCPNCGEDTELEKKNDTVLDIVEGAAKSYLAIYERMDRNDLESLNKALDIYQRLFKRLQQTTSEEMRYKYWEVSYNILKIYFYKNEFERIVDGMPPDMPPTDWDRLIPFPKWRNKIKRLVEIARKAIEEEK